MKDDEDLELAALQRQLDDAFETTRPRSGYEDELWLRIQARRPVWTRIRDAVTGFVDGIREAPAVPAAAVAAILVVAIGIGVVRLAIFPTGGGGPTSLATREGQGGAPYAAAPGTFGRLPSPTLQGRVTPADSQAPKTLEGAATARLYTGPAKLEWAGRLTIQVSSAPVYRYFEPSAATADQVATSLGASAQGPQGSYAGDGFTLTVRGSSMSPVGEPIYVLAITTAGPQSGAFPAAMADRFLTAHSLVPAWPYVVVVDQRQQGETRVLYLRQFDVPGQGRVYAVNGAGFRYGLEVGILEQRVRTVSGPLPITLEAADYPIIGAEDAVRFALASSPSGSEAFTPTPTVRLTSAELVYALAYAGDRGFYEPAFLFSGSFTYNGATYTKQVLVPAVSPAQRSS